MAFGKNGPRTCSPAPGGLPHFLAVPWGYLRLTSPGSYLRALLGLRGHLALSWGFETSFYMVGNECLHTAPGGEISCRRWLHYWEAGKGSACSWDQLRQLFRLHGDVLPCGPEERLMQQMKKELGRPRARASSCHSATSFDSFLFSWFYLELLPANAFRVLLYMIAR